MACRDAYKNKITNAADAAVNQLTDGQESEKVQPVSRLLFGVDSDTRADNLLQNNLTEFEWATRNKLYPNFWGRNITGANSLTKEEIEFLHDKGCKIAPVHKTTEGKTSQEQGAQEGQKALAAALSLDIPQDIAIFLDIADVASVTKEYLKGYIRVMSETGYVPGFKVNTDAKYDFDREFSRGLQAQREIFGDCLIWAVAPSLQEYERVTTTHLIHPDNWAPFAPSGITRNDIAVWQYGKECHPIYDDTGTMTTFNVNLVRNDRVIIERMF